MASKSAIGVIREQGLRSITEAMQRISAITGVEAVSLPQFNDPAYQEAMQLETLGKWAISVADVVAPLPDAEPEEKPEDAPVLKVMSNKQLYALAAELKLELAPRLKKDDIIAAIEKAQAEAAEAKQT